MHYAPEVATYSNPAQRATESQEPERYAVQLRLSSDPLDAAQVPQLDIFDLYHLYSDMTVEHNQLRHALRLGFFKHVHTARAVARYLEPYFGPTTIVQIESAEVVRSLQHHIAPRKDVGASGLYASIELTAPPEPPGASIPLQHHASGDKTSRGSLWSWLFRQR